MQWVGEEDEGKEERRSEQQSEKKNASSDSEGRGASKVSAVMGGRERRRSDR